jgi:hypothetical protein
MSRMQPSAKSSTNRNSRRGVPVPQTGTLGSWRTFAWCTLRMIAGITWLPSGS